MSLMIITTEKNFLLQLSLETIKYPVIPILSPRQNKGEKMYFKLQFPNAFFFCDFTYYTDPEIYILLK
jgi:hypothetical protein